MVRRTRQELEKLLKDTAFYLSFRNQEGETLSYRDLAKLLDVSKSRVAQLRQVLESQDDATDTYYNSNNR